MSSKRSEHMCQETRYAAPPPALLLGASADGRTRADRSARCVVRLESADHPSVAEIARHIGDEHGRDTSVRRAACRPDEAGVEHAVLRRLLGEPHVKQVGAPAGAPVGKAVDAPVGAPILPLGEPILPHQIRNVSLIRLNDLLKQTPLVVVITDAQWCDQGTLRCIDHVMRGAPGKPLTVLLSLPPGALGSAPAAFHELMARDYCSVVEVAALQPADTGRPTGMDLDELGRREPHLLRVAQAASVLRSTDADLVGALAALPAGVVGRALDTARDLGLLPDRIPAQGECPPLDRLLDVLPATARERLRMQAAEILNDAARPARQVADLLLGQATLDRPWMTAILKEAASATRRDRPASAVSYLRRLHQVCREDLTVRCDLGAMLLDIDPAAAHAHLKGVLARTDDPDIRTRAAVPLQLTALMTHIAPDTPDGLDTLLHALRAGRAGGAPPAGQRHTPVSTDQTSGDDTREHLTLAAGALRSALSGTEPAAAVAEALQVLRTDRPRAAWARVAAARVLALADDTRAALDHVDRTIADSGQREEGWAEWHARSARALLLLESGHPVEAAVAARAAFGMAEGQGWAERTGLPAIILALALVARGDLDTAEDTLRLLDGRNCADSVWEHHHHLMARAFVACGRGEPAAALELMERCGASLDAAGIGNPVFTTWWVHSTDLLMELGRPSAARERAEFGQQQAERWPTARSTGLSLLARSVVATTVDRVELLAESVALLAGSSDRHHHALAELRLGKALLRFGDTKAARGHLHEARTVAVRSGVVTLAEAAYAALAAAGARPLRAALSAAELPVAEMAAAGASNRAIADALYLTVRTVEYHLTNAYRKLGVTGRTGLAERLPARRPQTSARALGSER